MKNLYIDIRGTDENILEAEEGTIQVDRAGMFLCFEGSTAISLDGMEYSLSANSMVVYFPYSQLHIISKSADLRGIIVSIDLDESQQIISKVSDFDKVLLIKQTPLVRLSREQTVHIKELIEAFVYHYEAGQDDDSATEGINKLQTEMLRDCVALEIIKCYSPLVSGGQQSKKRHDEILRKFIFLLYDNYQREHSVTFYASKLCITTRYFSSVVHERSGRTPTQWINNALLAESKKLLCETYMSIKEISERLNFPNQSYFGKWFKNLAGCGPLDFRNGKRPVVAQSEPDVQYG